MRKLIVVVFLGALLGCQQSARVEVQPQTSRFVGTWSSIRGNGNTISISEENGNLIVAESYKLDGKLTVKKYPGQEVNGALEVKNGLGVSSFLIDSKSSNLIRGEHEFEKK